MTGKSFFWLMSLLSVLLQQAELSGQIAVRGDIVHTMAGPAIKQGIVVIKDGKIDQVGLQRDVRIPEGYKILQAKVVTPGLIDAHSTVGFSGILNYDHDQDQLERSEPMQPELRAIDAYNGQDELVAWVRSFGITTIHTGHAPGELISGQTFIVKTTGNTVKDAILSSATAVAVTLSSAARKADTKSPGTRGKMMSMLRSNLIKANEYIKANERATSDPKQEPPPRDLRLEALGQVLKGELKLLVTSHRSQDIASALRLANEFKLKIWLDGAAEAYNMIEEIKQAKVSVIMHATMKRATGEAENLSFETAAKLVQAKIPVAIQSGYEAYVPKTRVALFEAGLAAANGLTFDQALAAITIDAAKILGIDKRVGSIEIGKDGDLALYDGDPFEYTSHCVGVVIDGTVVSQVKR